MRALTSSARIPAWLHERPQHGVLALLRDHARESGHIANITTSIGHERLNVRVAYAL
jgi:hypothetical protein